MNEGLFEPPWVTWLSADIAKRVRGAFPGTRRKIPGGVELRVEETAPLEMNNARYALYRNAWAALDPLRIRWSEQDNSADMHPWRHALDWFDAPKLAALDGFMKQRLADAKERCTLYHRSVRALGDGRGKEAYADASKAIALGGGPALYENLVEAALSFDGPGKPDEKLTKKALAAALPFAKDSARLPFLAAKALLVLDDRDGALKVLAEAKPDVSGGEPKPDPLETDAAFAPITGDGRFRRAFGWAKQSDLKRLRALDAKPNLKAFPKLAKAIAGSHLPILFGHGATKKEVADVERALGLKLPASYRTMLATFDGAIFHDGREILYGTADLATRNAHRERRSDALRIGRNLELRPISASEVSIREVFYGLREQRTTLSWKTLDACLTDLLRRKS